MKKSINLRKETETEKMRNKIERVAERRYSPQPVDGGDGEGKGGGQEPDEEDGNPHHPQYLSLARLQQPPRGKEEIVHT